MFSKLRAKWRAFEALPVGERFERFYCEQQKTSRWVKFAYLLAALVSFVVGVILAFIPGPAVVFFALTAALLATQSRKVAHALDRAEVKGRAWLASVRAWWGRHRRELHQR
jgi:hypothetical protein